jgi:hypothetical protein
VPGPPVLTGVHDLLDDLDRLTVVDETITARSRQQPGWDPAPVHIVSNRGRKVVSPYRVGRDPRPAGGRTQPDCAAGAPVARPTTAQPRQAHHRARALGQDNTALAEERTGRQASRNDEQTRTTRKQERRANKNDRQARTPGKQERQARKNDEQPRADERVPEHTETITD